MGQDRGGTFRRAVPQQGDGILVVQHLQGVGGTLEVQVLEKFETLGSAQVIQQLGQLTRVEQSQTLLGPVETEAALRHRERVHASPVEDLPWRGRPARAPRQSTPQEGSPGDIDAHEMPGPGRLRQVQV